MEISIGHTKRVDGIYVGRPTPLGNPYIVGRDGDRGDLILPYKRWLWNQMQDPNSEATTELVRILKLAEQGPITLTCWCHPKPCHATVIRDAVLWMSQFGA